MQELGEGTLNLVVVIRELHQENKLSQLESQKDNLRK